MLTFLLTGCIRMNVDINIKKNGKAATGSTKIKKKYYVFRSNGKLVRPKKTATVRVKSRVYRVKKNGCAAPGWQKKTYYYAKNGERCTGIHLIDGKLYAFGSGGKKNASKTKALQDASVFYEDAGPLFELLGKPKNQSYGTTCLDGDLLRGKTPGGQDGIFAYKHIVIATYLEPDGEKPGYLWTMTGN